MDANGLACLWKSVEAIDGYPRFRCERCGEFVEVHGDVETVLASLPPCGQIRDRANKVMEALLQARNEALAAGKPFPPLIKRVGSYRKAVARWVKAGRPCRPDEEVERIFDTLCEPCEHFRPEKQSCNLCGCKVRRDGAKFKNKIAMMTECCPLVPPKWGGGDSSVSR